MSYFDIENLVIRKLHFNTWTINQSNSFRIKV